MEFCKINATCWVEIFFVFIFLFLTIVLLLGLAFRDSWHSLISDDGCQRKWSGLLTDFLIVLHNAVHECCTLAIRVKEINKTKTLFASLCCALCAFSELWGALRSTLLGFQFSPLASVRLSVPSHFFEIFIRIFYFSRRETRSLESIWNSKAHPRKPPWSFFFSG